MSDTSAPDPDKNALALHYLMARFIKSPSPEVAIAVSQHLTLLIHHPKVSATQRHDYQQFLAYWWEAVEASLPADSLEEAKQKRLSLEKNQQDPADKSQTGKMH